MNICTLNNIRHQAILLTLISLILFTLINFTKVDKTGGDSYGSLLLSQTLITDRTLKLDQYSNIDSYGYTVRKKNNHQYYYFPVGSSFSSIPFVYFAQKVFNLDMNDKNQQGYLQRKIAGLTVVICFLLLYFISRMYLSFTSSASLALVFTLGTSLVSSMGTALWSHNFASVYSLFSLYFYIKITKENNHKFWWLLAVCLFLAYLTRPTLSLLSVTIVFALFFQKKWISIKTAGLIAILLVGFVWFSYKEFGQFLPDYYMPKRLAGDAFWAALYGNTFSPARGLFIFSPFLLLLLVSIKLNLRVLNDNKWLWFFIAWIMIHLIIVSRFPTWWAGYSFGARFMLDVLPAFFIWSVLYLKANGIKPIPVKLFLLIAIPISIFINSYQGLYNRYSELWNGSPSVDKYNQFIFDWSYPPFMHNKLRHEKRIEEFKLFKRDELMKSGPKDIFNKVIPHNSKKVFFKGWSDAPAKQRWSLGTRAEVFFNPISQHGINGELTLSFGSLGHQSIEIFINEIKVAELYASTYNESVVVKFNPSILLMEQTNVIRFNFSNPHSPPKNPNDKRKLAVAMRWFSIK